MLRYRREEGLVPRWCSDPPADDHGPDLVSKSNRCEVEFFVSSQGTPCRPEPAAPLKARVRAGVRARVMVGFRARSHKMAIPATVIIRHEQLQIRNEPLC